MRIFRTLSRLRGKRIFHPVGSSYNGTIALNSDAREVFGKDLPKQIDVVLRVSRAFHIPVVKSDFYGIAIRLQLKDEHQDLLFASAGSGPVSKYFFKPSVNLLCKTFSMDLPYKIRNKRYIFWLILDKEVLLKNDKTELPLDTEFSLQASKLIGRRRELGRIKLGKQLAAATNERIRYNPWNTLDNIRPAGIVNKIRKQAYVQSQLGRQ